MSGQAGKEFEAIPLVDRGQLTDYYRGNFSVNQLIGFENEKPVICYGPGEGVVRPASYADIQRLLLAIHNRDDYKPMYEFNDLPGDGSLVSDGKIRRHMVGLQSIKPGFEKQSLTIEPASQFELSGHPHESLWDVLAEYKNHMNEAHDACEILGLNMLTVGAYPTVLGSNLPVVPKKRYQIFMGALDRNLLGRFLATSTATTQVNLDISDDQDFIVKMQTGLSLQPIITAMFANSPFEDGTVTGHKSMRNNYWLRTGLNRVGIPAFVFDDDFSLERWIDFVFDDIKMLAIKRGDELHATRGGYLQQFMDGAYADGVMKDERGLYNEHLVGETARFSDALDLCTAIWTEVRPTSRGGIEFRGGDNGSIENNVAMAAIWTGLMYDSRVLNELHQTVMQWTDEERQDLLNGAKEEGLDFVFKGTSLKEFAQDLVRKAEEGLASRSQSLGIENEADLLAPAKRIAQTGVTPADEMIERYSGAWEYDISRIFDEQVFWPDLREFFQPERSAPKHRHPPSTPGPS